VIILSICWSLKQIVRDKIHYFINKSVDFVSDYLLSCQTIKLLSDFICSRQIGFIPS
jgi:hypothetical protein